MLHHKRSIAGSILIKSGLRLESAREEIARLKAMTPVGWTSRWVAAARALETESANPLFRDPFARDLAGEAGFDLMSSMREVLGVSPTTGPEPYFSIRTRFFDDAIVAAIRRSSIRQVVILAAGMDTRAFRIDWPSGVVLFEIDRDEIFDYKEAILERRNARPACDRRIVRADLTAAWSAAILSAGFDPGRPSVILVEGLLAFLSEHAATQLFKTIATLACPGSCLALDAINEEMLVSPYLSGYLKKLREFGCPWRFGVDDPEKVLAEHGWQATIFGPGEPEANYGRWPYPLPSPAFAGLPMKTPRAFLILARKPGGAREMVASGDPGDDPLVAQYESHRSGPYTHA
jgi:methyltransferase (TIGR00027 family)